MKIKDGLNHCYYLNVKKFIDRQTAKIDEEAEMQIEALKKEVYEQVRIAKDKLSAFPEGIQKDLQPICLPSLPEINEILCQEPGKVIVISGRPSMGKTVLMLSLIAATPQDNHLVFSSEYSKNPFLKRMTNSSEKNDTSVTDCEIREYRIEDDIAVAGKKSRSVKGNMVAAGNVFVFDKPALTFDEFLGVTEWQGQHFPVRSIWIDDFDLLKTPEDFKENLKEFARSSGITIVVLSQLPHEFQPDPFSFEQYIDLSSPGYIDGYYYLVRPNYYGVLETASGMNLLNIAILYCLKGELVGKAIYLKFDPKNRIFRKAEFQDLLDIHLDYPLLHGYYD